jgi:hypothetical protein
MKGDLKKLLIESSNLPESGNDAKGRKKDGSTCEQGGMVDE